MQAFKQPKVLLTKKIFTYNSKVTYLEPHLRFIKYSILDT